MARHAGRGGGGARGGRGGGGSRQKDGGGGRGGGGGGRGEAREITVSKAMSYLLRHGAEKEGVNIDEGGWVRVGDLVSCVLLFRALIDAALIFDIHLDMQRFQNLPAYTHMSFLLSKRNYPLFIYLLWFLNSAFCLYESCRCYLSLSFLYSCPTSMRFL